MKTSLSVVALILAASALGFAVFGGETYAPLGAAAGPDVTSRTFFFDDAIIGGPNNATSSVGTATYTAAQIINNKIITHTAASALTATFPASTTLGALVPKAGDTATRYILPVTTGITFAGGTGSDLNTASSTKFCVQGQVCRFDFVRKANSDIEILMTSSSGN